MTRPTALTLTTLAALTLAGYTAAFLPSAHAAAIAPDAAPVIVKFRSAAFRTAFVATLKNDAGKLMRNVKVKVENSALGDSHEWTVAQWESGKTIEYGWKEGWDFFPGDNLTISADNYTDVSVMFKKDMLTK